MYNIADIVYSILVNPNTARQEQRQFLRRAHVFDVAYNVSQNSVTKMYNNSDQFMRVNAFTFHNPDLFKYPDDGLRMVSKLEDIQLKKRHMQYSKVVSMIIALTNPHTFFHDGNEDNLVQMAEDTEVFVLDDMFGRPTKRFRVLASDLYASETTMDGFVISINRRPGAVDVGYNPLVLDADAYEEYLNSSQVNDGAYIDMKPIFGKPLLIKGKVDGDGENAHVIDTIDNSVIIHDKHRPWDSGYAIVPDYNGRGDSFDTHIFSYYQPHLHWLSAGGRATNWWSPTLYDIVHNIVDFKLHINLCSVQGIRWRLCAERYRMNVDEYIHLKTFVESNVDNMMKSSEPLVLNNIVSTLELASSYTHTILSEIQNLTGHGTNYGLQRGGGLRSYDLEDQKLDNTDNAKNLQFLVNYDGDSLEEPLRLVNGHFTFTYPTFTNNDDIVEGSGHALAFEGIDYLDMDNVTFDKLSNLLHTNYRTKRIMARMDMLHPIHEWTVSGRFDDLWMYMKGCVSAWINVNNLERSKFVYASDYEDQMGYILKYTTSLNEMAISDDDALLVIDDSSFEPDLSQSIADIPYYKSFLISAPVKSNNKLLNDRLVSEIPSSSPTEIMYTILKMSNTPIPSDSLVMLRILHLFDTICANDIAQMDNNILVVTSKREELLEKMKRRNIDKEMSYAEFERRIIFSIREKYIPRLITVLCALAISFMRDNSDTSLHISLSDRIKKNAIKLLKTSFGITVMDSESFDTDVDHILSHERIPQLGQLAKDSNLMTNDICNNTFDSLVDIFSSRRKYGANFTNANTEVNETPIPKIGNLETQLNLKYQIVENESTMNGDIQELQKVPLDEMLVKLCKVLNVPTVDVTYAKWTRINAFKDGVNMLVQTKKNENSKIKELWVDLFQNNATFEQFEKTFNNVKLTETYRMFPFIQNSQLHNNRDNGHSRIRHIIKFITFNIKPMLLRLSSIVKGYFRASDETNEEWKVIRKCMSELHKSNSIGEVIDLLDTYLIPTFCNSDYMVLHHFDLSNNVQQSAILTFCVGIIMEIVLTLSEYNGTYLIAVHVLRIFEEKNIFNRSDAIQDDIRLINEEREEIKRQKIRALEMISPEDKELIQEYREIRGMGWDDIVKEFSPYDANNGANQEYNNGIDKQLDTLEVFEEGEMDARDMYWYADGTENAIQVD